MSKKSTVKKTTVPTMFTKNPPPTTTTTDKETDKEDKSKNNRLIPWVEKYRPKKVSDVAYQDEVVAVLTKCLAGSDFPNLLFYGPPGTGKTSTILAAAHELFGPQLFRDRVMELNSSDERGINVIREKVKKFAQFSVITTRSDGMYCPPFKLIILDECDSMTKAAQAALRRTMERESKTTRFCLICNYISRIIDPITSRCAKFRFKPLKDNIIEERLQAICNKENVQYEPEAITELGKCTDGDMRKAVTFLQSVARFRTNKLITVADVHEITGIISESVIESLYQVCHSGSYEKLATTVKNVLLEGYAAHQLLLQLHDYILGQMALGNEQKAIIFEKAAIVDGCLLDGADEYLQMMNFLCTLSSDDYSDYDAQEQQQQQIQTEPLVFTRRPQSTQVAIGSSAIFYCSSSSSPITWFKNDVPLGTGSKHMITNQYLQILNIDENDEAIYDCTIRNALEMKTASANLTVLYAPRFVPLPDTYRVGLKNLSIELHCRVRGNPKPTITWHKSHINIRSSHRMHLLDNNQILRINQLRNDDAGLYTCNAENSLRRISAATDVRVQEPIPPLFSRRMSNLTTYDSASVELECTATGDPQPKIEWFRDSFPIHYSIQYILKDDGSLLLPHVTANQSGYYTCQASNYAGREIHSFWVSVVNDNQITDELIDRLVQQASVEVNRAVAETIRHLQDRRRPRTPGDLMSLMKFPKPLQLTLAKTEDIFERSLDLVHRYVDNITFASEYSKSEVRPLDFRPDHYLTARQLERLALVAGCVVHQLNSHCNEKCLAYRTADGTCNNFKNPFWGASLTALTRWLHAQYENGFNTPRGWNDSKLYNGYKLPSAREVSSRLIATKTITPDPAFSHMLMQWGQFQDHDMSLTVQATSNTRFSDSLRCLSSCSYEPPCYPIRVPDDDHLRQERGSCLEFVRSAAICLSGETSFLHLPYRREQINSLTSFFDASNVYGSTVQDAWDLRERSSGKGLLRVHSTSQYPKGLLPFSTDTPVDCQRDRQASQIGCFLAGDHRVNEQVALIAVHTIWVRQHNRFAKKLSLLNSNWTDEQVYQETRKIIEAQLQIITYKHWLPFIIGDEGMNMLGSYKGYNRNVNPTISNVFATAAFRFGHSLINPVFYRLNSSLEPIPEGNLLLRDAFFSPWRVKEQGGIDPLLRGMFGVPAKIKLPQQILNVELTERLFHVTRAISLDLAAANIQRSRDHGLQSYTAWRKFCNLTSNDINDFDDLRYDISDEQTRNTLRDVYKHVDNIDVWVGGILEDNLPGAKVGPTFRCLILKQFKALRDGDRYWYEKSGIFTRQQINSLEKTSLAKVICENGDHIERIPKNVFLNAIYPRDYVSCSHIEDIDLEPWRGCCNQNMAGSNAVCNIPAILSYDPFPNYEPSRTSTNTRQKREIVEQEVIEDEIITKDDQLELEKLRQQVDDVLKKFATFDKRLTTGTHCYDQNTRKLHKNGTKWHVHKCLVCQCKDATSLCEIVC
ncbi:unnamed protein product [Rotaria sordida]|uniref:Replication factor C subunit 2 n=1 Tax=Rotaria sordida TaxID=392033 RepID=A0A813SDY4_9BILA|nr:unnamed protein product [Rotaria sordida]